ncbi:hypothetical protein HYT53_06215 [Candidatus Woesearchaeota archaeon]|nr:hypothetical protein [Candidatus Woesearchaeota archaeon]
MATLLTRCFDKATRHSYAKMPSHSFAQITQLTHQKSLSLVVAQSKDTQIYMPLAKSETLSN